MMMTSSLRRVLFGIVVVAGVALGFMVGVLVGRDYEQKQYELIKLLAPMQADEYLQQKEVDKAISMLHFAKATETIAGDQDVSLGKAYVAKGQPCLGKEFLASGLNYMRINKLTELPGYLSTVALLEQASAECEKSR